MGVRIKAIEEIQKQNELKFYYHFQELFDSVGRALTMLRAQIFSESLERYDASLIHHVRLAIGMLEDCENKIEDIKTQKSHLPSEMIIFFNQREFFDLVDLYYLHLGDTIDDLNSNLVNLQAKNKRLEEKFPHGQQLAHVYQIVKNMEGKDFLHQVKKNLENFGLQQFISNKNQKEIIITELGKYRKAKLNEHKMLIYSMKSAVNSIESREWQKIVIIINQCKVILKEKKAA